MLVGLRELHQQAALNVSAWVYKACYLVGCHRTNWHKSEPMLQSTNVVRRSLTERDNDVKHRHAAIKRAGEMRSSSSLELSTRVMVVITIGCSTS